MDDTELDDTELDRKLGKPKLDGISYSREECIAIIRDYYSFLTKMYLREEEVLHPPVGGWPSITPESMADLGKTDEVIFLLRHLSYVGRRNNYYEDPHGAAFCHFANWHLKSLELQHGRITGDALRLTSEGADIYEDFPPEVICLTSGDPYNPVFLLDTELGIIYWHECPGEIKDNPARQQVCDDPYNWAPENEADWRGGAGKWTVKDFFEILKDQFIALNFIPVDSSRVLDVYAQIGRNPPCDGWIERVQAIYRHHGWPDLENFRKNECLEVIKAALREEFPQL
ncbi:hypothetical protein LX32DRAFT_660714 [Colletotrichum zoysiae]|uniref:Uncharacterized protein n=1 Tax=Colletotrichum zoysiae TaxID=1216348 RepID=A0AAD9HRU1_9PEZI|nr:hypothetical protein LX32DRAFT_660714 [Colletotrichum zoysiae]